MNDASSLTTDFFGSRRKLEFQAGSADFYSLPTLEANNVGRVSELPLSIRILLECAVRNQDNQVFMPEHVTALLKWGTADSEPGELPYKPARVVLQDFTGVPAVVDLAAMRDAMREMNCSPDRINPILPCDLVIDHSVQVDYFGSEDALRRNEEIEFERNRERYQFLKWGQQALSNFRVVPPATGIVHQVNLEHLSQVTYWNRDAGLLYPDSCVGTDSHTPMVNGLGVLAWGVGGIEAEAVMLGQAIYMLVPEVVGFKLSGELSPGVTATDLVLRVTEMCRAHGVVGKFVEFFGAGVENLPVADRATISNMAPEQGSTVSLFPVDERTLEYLRLSGRTNEEVDLVERYWKEQGFFGPQLVGEEVYSSTLELDLGSVEASVAGPKRPQDRVALKDLKDAYAKMLIDPVGPRGLGLSKKDLKRVGVVSDEVLTHGSVVIAAITSCTNTSNPAVMIGAGLLAKKAVSKGLKVKPYVKTSLAPGSGVVTEYLTASGLLPYLEQLGFHVVGYGCTTCIGNSGPLPEEVAKSVSDNDLVVSAVLSGNRNFEGRIHPLTRTNFLASPPLVVAFALAGTTAIDLTSEPLGVGSDGEEVFLSDIWPTEVDIERVLQNSLSSTMYRERYENVWEGSSTWQQVAASAESSYKWDPASTYVRLPPFFKGVDQEEYKFEPISGLRVLGLFKDSVTTDHISPAGAIAPDSPAAAYLLEHGVARSDWNSYGARRGNHEVMMRGTFGNIRIKNGLVPGEEGNISLHHPSGERGSFFEVAERYRQEGTPLMILAGKEYGSGSSRDWAAKGPALLGVRVVLAESYERIHRSNLIGMGILPLEFLPGESVSSLGLKGDEVFDLEFDGELEPRSEVSLKITGSDGSTKRIRVLARADTPVELSYLGNGGILHTVLKNFARES